MHEQLVSNYSFSPVALVNTHHRRLLASILVASPLFLGVIFFLWLPVMLEWLTPIPEKKDLASISVEIVTATLQSEPHLLAKQPGGAAMSFYLPNGPYGGRPIAPMADAQWKMLQGANAKVYFFPAWRQYSKVRRIMQIDIDQVTVLSYDRAVGILKRDREIVTTFFVLGGLILVIAGLCVVWLEYRLRVERRL